MEAHTTAPALLFGAEVARSLPALKSFTPADCLGPDTILEVRAKLAEWPVPSASELRGGGKLRVTETEGAHADSVNVPLLVCRPAPLRMTRYRLLPSSR